MEPLKIAPEAVYGLLNGIIEVFVNLLRKFLNDSLSIERHCRFRMYLFGELTQGRSRRLLTAADLLHQVVRVQIRSFHFGAIAQRHYALVADGLAERA